MFSFLRKKPKKTFRPLKAHKEGTKRAELHAIARRTLGSGDMAAAVELPEGEDENEWLAMQTHDFYQETLILFSLIEDNLTEEAFPSMTAGPKYEYFWQDETEYKTPTQLPAKKYIQRLLAWVDEYLSDSSVFPTDSDMVFPENFRSVVQRIFRRLFRIYAHIYYHHWDSIRSMGADAHLNTCFKHFIFFVRRFDLISSEELAPLDELIASFLADHDASGAGGAAAAAASAGDA